MAIVTHYFQHVSLKQQFLAQCHAVPQYSELRFVILPSTNSAQSDSAQEVRHCARSHFRRGQQMPSNNVIQQTKCRGNFVQRWLSSSELHPIPESEILNPLPLLAKGLPGNVFVCFVLPRTSLASSYRWQSLHTEHRSIVAPAPPKKRRTNHRAGWERGQFLRSRQWRGSELSNVHSVISPKPLQHNWLTTFVS